MVFLLMYFVFSCKINHYLSLTKGYKLIPTSNIFCFTNQFIIYTAFLIVLKIANIYTFFTISTTFKIIVKKDRTVLFNISYNIFVISIIKINQKLVYSKMNYNVHSHINYMITYFYFCVHFRMKIYWQFMMKLDITFCKNVLVPIM